ncbi:MAG: hypothetical protein AMXMBFR53_16040 [Gemmatimonadota bacterium]
MRPLRRLVGLAAILAAPGCTLVGYPSEPAPVPVGTPELGAAVPEDRTAVPLPEPERPPPDFRRDRPPTNPRDIDLDTISDAVPTDEPRSPYGNMAEYQVFGRTYRTLESAEGYREEGVASWYGEEFHGRSTSSGEPYDMYAMSAAHRTLPLPSFVEITNLDNGRRVVVRVNDRGPFHGGRLIDVSYAAAHRLGMLGRGTARVRVRALVPEG